MTHFAFDHFEDDVPEVRTTVVDTHDAAGSVRVSGIGVFAPHDGPEQDPIFSLSEQSAFDLGVALIAQASSADIGTVYVALRSKGL